MDLILPNLGRYRIEREIGRGGMGIVYAAEDPVLERRVAIKILSQEFAADPQRIGRFRREARVLAALSHSNIASLYSLEEPPDGPPCLVMELIEGRGLEEIVAAGPVPFSRMRDYGIQICRALEAAHSRGIIHRDLKPENVRVTSGDLVKVLDFGLAAERERGTGADPGEIAATLSLLTQPGLIMGTAGYMSPEQARGLEQDERTDLFALGCVLFCGLTGQPPFRGNTIIDRIVATVASDPNWSGLPLGVPMGFRALITRCLNKEAAARPSSAAEVRSALEALPGEVGEANVLLSSEPVGPAPRTNLPRSLTSFVGRDRELRELQEMLVSEVLVTLTGVGGCGKTRLAVEAAARAGAQFPDGIWFVELASLSGPERVAAAVAKAVGVAEEAGRPVLEVLSGALRGRTGLLVLDNCEHLLVACGDLAQRLLRDGPNLTILATSREALGLPGEVLFEVSSMNAAEGPDEALHSDAVQLFLDRARAVKREFTLTEAEVPLAAAICRRLDGIPLAIELAAARVRVLSIEQIHTKLNDRFRFLTGGARTSLERHRTLRAAMEWSYNLLKPEEKVLLQMVSVFAGGWTLESAAFVCGEGMDEFEALDLLTRLVEKSMVQVQETPDHERRFRLLETVRQFAREELIRDGEPVPAQDRHLEYFLNMAEEAGRMLRGPAQGFWLERLQTEHENLLAGLDWCDPGEGGGEKALRLCAAVWSFWMVRGHFSLGREQMRRALRRPGAEAPTPLRAAVLGGASALAGTQGDFEDARRLAEEALIIARLHHDESSMARCLNILGLIAAKRGDDAAARTHHEQSLALRRGAGDEAGVSASLNNLGSLALAQGDLAAARRWFEEGVAVQGRLGDKVARAAILSNLGLVAGRQRDHQASRRFYEESLELHRGLGNQHGVAEVMKGLGHALLEDGDAAGAGDRFFEGLRILEAQGDRAGVADMLNNLGTVALHRGDFAEARRFYERGLRIQEESGDVRKIGTVLGNLGLAAHLEGNLHAAGLHYRESLRIRSSLGDDAGLARLLENTGQLAAALARHDLAAGLLGAAAGLRARLDLPLTEAERPRHERTLDDLQSVLGEVLFVKNQTEGAGWSCRLAVDRALQWLSDEKG